MNIGYIRTVFIDADRIYLFLITVYVLSKYFSCFGPIFLFLLFLLFLFYFYAYKTIGLNIERGRIVSKLFKSFSFSLSNILLSGHTLWQHL